MADLSSMTKQERMNTILNDGMVENTYQEACNLYLKSQGTYNSVDYSSIGENEYTTEEVWNILAQNSGLHSKTSAEILNDFADKDDLFYTEREALNAIGTKTNLDNALP